MTLAIIDLQRRLTEAGRIRIGHQVPTSNGKGKRPEKLETFRLTSADRMRIEQAAQLYGGTPQEWDAPAGRQWEVITQSDALNVIVPPSDMAFSQWYEQWSGGGCQRRCDGRVESISDGPCLCDPDNRECDIHTRLSVMLRDLPGLGVWRVDTSGWYAALELQGAVEVVQLAAGQGQMLPARLRLDQRMVKRPGQGTRRFAVPVLDVEVTPAQLMGGGAVAIEASPSRPLDGRAALTPVPQSVPERPVASIEAQSTTPRATRRRTAQPVPETGLRPRTADQAASGADPVKMSTLAQQQKLAILLDKEEGTHDRAGKLAYLEKQFGRPFTTSKELTRAECSGLIDFLESSGQPDDPDQPTEGAQA